LLDNELKKDNIHTIEEENNENSSILLPKIPILDLIASKNI